MALYPRARAELAADSGTSFEVPDIAAKRAQERREAAAEPRDALDYVVDIDADGVPARLYRPRTRAPVLVYAYGGGWVFGDLETHDRFARYLALRTDWAVLSVDYRRAPEHPYPAPLDDLQTAVGWVRTHGTEHRLDTSTLVGVGDSSGANLIAGLSVRDPATFDGHVLVYPPLDSSCSGASHRGEDNQLLAAAEMGWYWNAYAAGSLQEPDVAPAYAAELSAMPPTLMITAEHDVLRDEGELFAARLAEAGVDVVGQRCLGMAHGFWRHPWTYAAAADSIGQVAAALHRWMSV